MAKLKVAEATEKTTKGGKPYLNIKSSTGKYYSIWEESRFIWHLFTPGAELDVTVATNGAFSNITGVIGLEGENATTGLIEPKNGIPSAWDKLFLRLEGLEKKIDFLIEEKKTLKGLENQGKEINLHYPLPNLSDLPEHNLD
jgi:hypothetical protein